MIHGSYKNENGYYKNNKMNFIKTTHKISEDDNKLTINIKITIDKEHKKYTKIVSKMLEKQQSPAIDIIKEIEKEHRKYLEEGKFSPIYYETNQK